MNISLITASFNSSNTLRDALDSVSTQIGRLHEHIIIDGGSDDGSLEILKRYCRNSVCNTSLVSQPDEGVYDALNKGIHLSTGDVIGFLHSDDVFGASDVLNKVSKAFSNPTIQAVYGDLEYRAKASSGRVIRYWQAGSFKSSSLAQGWMPPHPTLFLRRSVYESFGLFNTSYQISADYDFILRVFPRLLTAEIVYIPTVVTRMRVGGVSNRSLNNVVQKTLEDYNALRSNNIGGFRSLIRKNVRKLRQFFIAA